MPHKLYKVVVFFPIFLLGQRSVDIRFDDPYLWPLLWFTPNQFLFEKMCIVYWLSYLLLK